MSAVVRGAGPADDVFIVAYRNIDISNRTSRLEIGDKKLVLKSAELGCNAQARHLGDGAKFRCTLFRDLRAKHTDRDNARTTLHKRIHLERCDRRRVTVQAKVMTAVGGYRLWILFLLLARAVIVVPVVNVEMGNDLIQSQPLHADLYGIHVSGLDRDGRLQIGFDDHHTGGHMYRGCKCVGAE